MSTGTIAVRSEQAVTPKHIGIAGVILGALAWVVTIPPITCTQADLGKWRRERNWPIRANRAGTGVLRVRPQSRIARTRAPFGRVS